MNDSYISRNSLIVIGVWIAVCVSMGAAWTMALLMPTTWIYAAVLAATGCVLSAVAVVAHVRQYSARVCSLVRISAGLERRDAEVTRLR